MGRDKPLQARLEKPHLGAAPNDKSACNQTLPTPSRHCAGRDVKFPADLVHREDRLFDLLDRLPRRRRKILNKEPQVVLYVTPVKN
jgi:hypothetical protein